MLKKKKEGINAEEKFYIASQWQLMWRKFKKHKLAIFGGAILAIFYIVALFCEFFSPYGIYQRYPKHIYCPPQRIRFFDEQGFHLCPFVYGFKQTRNLETLKREYRKDETKKYPIYFFVHGNEYKLLGLFPFDIHFLGVKEGTMFLFGTGVLGRDLFSRNIYATRISLSIGLVGVAFSFILGCVLGGVSGYYGGAADMIIQRVIEFLLSMPTIPLWMALAAALPPDWPPIKVYFGITIILSIMGWCGLARVVRGKLLELREEDFALAAKIAGASEVRIIVRHLLPSFLSYLVVSLTLAIPYMILGETTLSFLGIGLRSPVVSWGVLLQNAQNFRTVALYSWLLFPSL
ncbi:MAG: ABC transporter permease subunit, partial [Firmicutes bacterium]|nr:ABC transporter permease subunit [Bacillota bacterium]